MIVEFLRRTRELMKDDKIELKKSGTVSKWIPTDLLKFSHHMLYQPSTLALFGEIDPASLASDFRLFDKNVHYFVLPLPRFIYSWFLSAELKARSFLDNSWLKNRDPPRASAFHRDRLELLLNNLEWISD